LIVRKLWSFFRSEVCLIVEFYSFLPSFVVEKTTALFSPLFCAPFNFEKGRLCAQLQHYSNASKGKIKF